MSQSRDDRFAFQPDLDGSARCRRRFCCSAARRAQAQQFSADLVMVRHDGDAPMPAGKLRVSGDKVRLETPELADGFFLIDGGRALGLFRAARGADVHGCPAIEPADPDVRAGRSGRSVPAVAGHGETRWDRGAGRLALRAHRRGDDRRRETPFIIARLAPSGQQFSGWIDAARKFPLRIKTQDGAIITAENIRDEAAAGAVVRNAGRLEEIRSARADRADQAERRVGRSARAFTASQTLIGSRPRRWRKP